MWEIQNLKKKNRKSMMSSRFCPRVSSGNCLVWSLTFTSLMCFWWTWCAVWESGLKFYIWISSLLSAAHWGNSPKPASVLSISPKTTDSGRTVYLRDLPLVSFSCTPLLQLWSFSRYVGYTRKDFFLTIWSGDERQKLHWICRLPLSKWTHQHKMFQFISTF